MPPDGSCQCLTPLDWLGADLIRLRGRRDGAVQVAGVNVWLTRVGEVLSRCEGVEEVAVRLGANGRPKAFLVPGREVEGGLARRADQSLRCGSPV